MAESTREPATRVRVSARWGGPLIGAGIILVTLFVLVEVMLVRGYEQHRRTDRQFGASTDTMTTLANIQRETFMLIQRVARLRSGDPVAPVTIRRALLERQIEVAIEAAQDHERLGARLTPIRADLRSFDELFARSVGADERVRRGARPAGALPVLDRVELSVKRTFDDEEHFLYSTLQQRLDENAGYQRLVIFFSLFALVLTVALSLVIARAVRGGFATAQQLLGRSEARFRRLVEQLPAVVYTVGLGRGDEDGDAPTLRYLSPQAEAIMGVAPVDALGDPAGLVARIPEDDRRALEKTLAAASTGAAPPPVEFRFQRPDGEVIWLRDSGAAVTQGDEGCRLHGLLFDVTAARQAEEDRAHIEAELQLARKLEAVGQLAAGIAHEINTPIQFVGDTLGFLEQAFGDLLRVQQANDELQLAAAGGSVDSEMLRRVQALNEEADIAYVCERGPAAFERATDGLRRVGEIVRAMREFAHPHSAAQGPVDINQAVRNTLIVAANAYKYVADVNTDLGDLPEVMCNGGDINQILLNLVVNAAHAIEDRVADSDERGEIDITTTIDGGDVIVAVADTGVGIPAEIADRVFDPFFTTKDVGRGTGQGLAIARTFATRHGGTLTFESVAGEGTTIVLRLPITGPDPDGIGASQPDGDRLQATVTGPSPPSR
jgi:PAS domain S-box-containing protein